MAQDRLADVGVDRLAFTKANAATGPAHKVRRRASAARTGNAHGGHGGVYVLDEPTTGPHLADVEQLLGLLDRLVESGTSVVVIEHDLAVMAHAHWIIDLGPGAGHDGGQVVLEHLAAYVDARD